MLLFVYNADSGLLNGLLDMGHKLVSPQTYPCSLCAVTYNMLGMKPAWRRFVQGLGRPVRFLHRDELAAEYGITDVPIPAIFAEQEGALALWMDATAMDRATSLEALQAAVLARVAAEAQPAAA